MSAHETTRARRQARRSDPLAPLVHISMPLSSDLDRCCDVFTVRIAGRRMLFRSHELTALQAAITPVVGPIIAQRYCDGLFLLRRRLED